MIIVMDNLNAVKPGADASLYAARTIIAKPTMADVLPPPGAPAEGASGIPLQLGHHFH